MPVGTERCCLGDLFAYLCSVVVGGVFSLSPPWAFAGQRGDLSDPNTKEVGSLEREVRVGVGAGARFWK